MMDKDTHLALQEQEYQQAKNKAICYDAAGLQLLNPTLSDVEAIDQATEIDRLQRAADGDVTGAAGTAAEAQSPEVPADQRKLQAMMAADLYAKHFPEECDV